MRHLTMIFRGYLQSKGNKLFLTWLIKGLFAVEKTKSGIAVAISIRAGVPKLSLTSEAMCFSYATYYFKLMATFTCSEAL